jgi:hypothetical protein
MNARTAPDDSPACLQARQNVSGSPPSETPRGLIATGQLRCCTPKIGEQSENVYENKGPLRNTREVGRRSEAAAFLPNVPNPVST